MGLAAVKAEIELQDSFSDALYDACNAVHAAVSSALDIQSAPEPPYMESYQWQPDSMPAFEGFGMDRFAQEAQSANNMLQQLSDTQTGMVRKGLFTSVLSPEAYQDINNLSSRMDRLKEKIWAISQNPVDVGTEQASAEFERLREQLNSAVRQQENLNEAMNGGDLSAINSAYLQLSETVSGVERHVRDNMEGQECFNKKVWEGIPALDGLFQSVKGVITEYLSMQNIKNVLNLSDELMQTTARLETMGKAFGDADASGQKLMQDVYASAQDARTSLSGMTDVVVQFGNQAGGSFESPQEVMDFVNLVQKQMTMAGVSAEDAANTQLQLAQALGSGSLQGGELNGIFGQTPGLLQNIADYMNVPIGKLQEMASEGGISADVIKGAIFSASDEINARFSEMPMTFGQIWQSIQNAAEMAFQPVLLKMNEMANSPEFQAFVEGVISAMEIIGNVVLQIFDGMGAVAGFIADNWAVIGPVVYGVAAALAVYYGWMILSKAAMLAFAVAQGILNAVMGMNPIVLIIMGVILLISIIYAICAAIAKVTGAAGSGFGIILGCVFVANAAFQNLGMLVGNIALAIWEAIKALCTNLSTAFHNAIANVKSWFYDLLSTGLTVIAGICEALNKLPFVSFDYSGISDAADDYAAKAAEERAGKREYENVIDALKEGFSAYEAFREGWASDAFDAGTEAGDAFSDKISEFFSGLSGEEGMQPDKLPQETLYNNYEGSGGGPAMENNAAQTAANTGQTAANTAVMADAMDISNEQLKYLRDIAERETVNRFTTASVKVEMTNHNRINSKLDLDGIVNGLTAAVGNAMSKTAEGVHI